MKRPEKSAEEILRQSLGQFKKISPEEMESAGAQALSYLKSQDGEHFRLASPSPAAVYTVRRWQWSAVAVITAAIALAVLVPTRTLQSAPAVLEDANGKRQIQYGELVRPTGDMSAMLSMADGPRVETRSMSEFLLERTDDGGTRIHLNMGGLIVDAASQRSGNLVVQTKEITALVSGAVSLVKAGEEGSSVAAIGGEVRVQQGATETTLRSGEQVATSPKMESISVKEELTWSREAVAHVAMLGQAVRTPTPQTPREDRLAFELATIRPAAPITPPVAANARGGGGGNQRANCQPQAQLDPRRFNVRGVSLYELIAIANGRCVDLAAAQAFGGVARILGGPDWIRSDRWDIEALIAQGSVDPLPTGFNGATGELWDGRSPKIQKMIRTLVEERFKVALRREVKEMPVYLLTVAPGGTKFQGNVTPVRLDRDGKPLPGPVFIGAGQLPPGTDFATILQAGPGGLNGVRPITPAEGAEVYRINTAARCNGNPCSSALFANQFMAIPASVVSGFLGRPVLDRTSIEGKVSFSLEWPRIDAPFVPGQIPPTPTFQEISKAFEAVGLQLKEDPKGMVETFVIDRAEKPSDN